MPAKKKPTQDKVNKYLDALRESGVTNMYGAGSYLENAFDLDRKTAGAMLVVWMRTFSERHPKVALMPADPVTASPLSELIARLREVEGKATKGPWTLWSAEGYHAIVTARRLCITVDRGEDFGDAESDATLIAEARNALPVLLSVIEEYRRALVEIPCSCVDDMNAHDDKHDWCALNIAKQALSRGDQLAKGEAPSHE